MTETDIAVANEEVKKEEVAAVAAETTKPRSPSFKKNRAVYVALHGACRWLGPAKGAPGTTGTHYKVLPLFDTGEGRREFILSKKRLRHLTGRADLVALIAALQKPATPATMPSAAQIGEAISSLDLMAPANLARTLHFFGRDLSLTQKDRETIKRHASKAMDFVASELACYVIRTSARAKVAGENGSALDIQKYFRHARALIGCVIAGQTRDEVTLEDFCAIDKLPALKAPRMAPAVMENSDPGPTPDTMHPNGLAPPEATMPETATEENNAPATRPGTAADKQPWYGSYARGAWSRGLPQTPKDP